MNDIIDRLLCRYAMGPIMPNGEPEFGWRDFSGPAVEGMTLPTPIMREAAEAIRALLAERDHYATECQEQARLLGMSAERELKLMAERDALREALQAMIEAHPIPSTACKERPVYEKARAALAQGGIMNTEQERAEFEAWLRVKPCGAAHDFAWEAWQAALESPEVQALRKDAERYRYWRVRRFNFVKDDGITLLISQDLDAAIDAAMGKQK